MGKFIFLSCILAMAACQKEPVKDCLSEIPALIIFGELNAELTGTENIKGSITFSAFGTYSSVPNDLIIPNKFFGAFLSTQKFQIDSIGIRFSGTSMDQKKQINSDYVFTKYSCDYIELMNVDHPDTHLILRR